MTADRVTIMAFGDCGAGKSTFLSSIAQIYAKQCLGAKGEKPINFESAKSASAVTTKVRFASVGNMMLIDTCGTNDSDKKRTDQ